VPKGKWHSVIIWLFKSIKKSLWLHPRLLIACVPSVSIGLTAGLMHFWLYGDQNQKRMPQVGGKTYENACYTS